MGIPELVLLLLLYGSVCEGRSPNHPLRRQSKVQPLPRPDTAPIILRDQHATIQNPKGTTDICDEEAKAAEADGHNSDEEHSGLDFDLGQPHGQKLPANLQKRYSVQTFPYPDKSDDLLKAVYCDQDLHQIGMRYLKLNAAADGRYTTQHLTPAGTLIDCPPDTADDNADQNIFVIKRNRKRKENIPNKKQQSTTPAPVAEHTTATAATNTPEDTVFPTSTESTNEADDSKERSINPTAEETPSTTPQSKLTTNGTTRRTESTSGRPSTTSTKPPPATTQPTTNSPRTKTTAPSQKPKLRESTLPTTIDPTTKPPRKSVSKSTPNATPRSRTTSKPITTKASTPTQPTTTTAMPVAPTTQRTTTSAPSTSQTSTSSAPKEETTTEEVKEKNTDWDNQTSALFASTNQYNIFTDPQRRRSRKRYFEPIVYESVPPHTFYSSDGLSPTSYKEGPAGLRRPHTSREDSQTFKDPRIRQNYRDTESNQNYGDAKHRPSFRDLGNNDNYRNDRDRQNFRSSVGTPNYRDPRNRQNFRDPENKFDYRDFRDGPNMPNSDNRPSYNDFRDKQNYRGSTNRPTGYPHDSDSTSYPRDRPDKSSQPGDDSATERQPRTDRPRSEQSKAKPCKPFYVRPKKRLIGISSLFRVKELRPSIHIRNAENDSKFTEDGSNESSNPDKLSSSGRAHGRNRNSFGSDSENTSAQKEEESGGYYGAPCSDWYNNNNGHEST